MLKKMYDQIQEHTISTDVSIKTCTIVTMKKTEPLIESKSLSNRTHQHHDLKTIPSSCASRVNASEAKPQESSSCDMDMWTQRYYNRLDNLDRQQGCRTPTTSHAMLKSQRVICWKQMQYCETYI